MVVYTLDFQKFEGNTAPLDGNLFHGYPIIGQLNVTEQKAMQDIALSIRDSFDRDGLKTPFCFWPRHGLRYIKDGITTDYVICFECLRYRKWINEKYIAEGGTASDPNQVFDDILTAAGVKLAPKLPGNQ